MKRFTSLIARERVGTFVFIDLVSLTAAFTIMINIRFSNNFITAFLQHLGALPILAATTITIYYAIGLYDLRLLRNSYDLIINIFTATALTLIAVAMIFYLIPLGIAPKVNLMIFASIFFLLDTAVRIYVHLNFQRPLHRVFLVSAPQEALALDRLFNASPHLGYKIVKHIFQLSGSQSHFLDEIRRTSADTVIVKRSLIPGFLLESLPGQQDSLVTYLDLADIYDVLFKKVFPCEKERYYFFTQQGLDPHSTYGRLRGMSERILIIILLIPFIPIATIIALCIVCTSGFPIFYSQSRIGRLGRQFRLWKFRTMIANAEPQGPIWSGKNDSRITKFGFFLRRTHLDELPQLFNIFKGEMSFVGPRPERPEFVGMLKKEIPLYDYRHLVLPGLTGWAQLNYPYGSSMSDAQEKLMYDLYYIKHRSFVLDLIICIRSIPLLLNQWTQQT